MNTGKQINVMVLVLFISVIALGVYTVWDPTRAENAQEDQIDESAGRAATTFALNCRLCHGDSGQGGAAGGRLPAALPLDRLDLRGFSEGVFDPVAHAAAIGLVSSTIMCGRVATVMPAWAESRGGALNEEQIRQLVVLITGGGEEGFWELAQEHADEIDAEATEHATVRMPDGVFTADESRLIVNNAAPFGAGQDIRIRSLVLEVERGIDGTEPSAHKSETVLTSTTGEGAESVEGGEPDSAGHSLVAAVGPEDAFLRLTSVAGIEVDDTLQLGNERIRVINVVEEERVRILPQQVEVDRAVGGTQVAAHESGTELLKTEFASDEPPETGETLSEPVTADETVLTVSGFGQIREGEILQLEDEQVRVTDLITGLPGPGQAIAQDIGRTPKRFLVSGSEGLDEGMMFRLGGELLRVNEVSTEGLTDVVLAEVASPTDSRIAVSDPAFFRTDYVMRVGDEFIRVVGPVDTGQALGETIGRAQTSFEVSGSLGLRQGDIIRLGSELLRITRVVDARVTVERGAVDEDGEETRAGSHDRYTAFLKSVVGEGEDPDSGEALLAPARADDSTLVVTGTVGIALDETYQLDDELVTVTDVEPARLRVERAVQGTERGIHTRRSPIFVANLLQVERGVEGSAADRHSAGDEILMTELTVDRAVDGTDSQVHGKGDEIFFDHELVVERGVRATEPADHPNGSSVLDFVLPPEGSEPLKEACGSLPRLLPQEETAEPTAEEGPTPTAGPTPAVAGEEVAVSLTEFTVGADPATVAAGSVTFNAGNDGLLPHNLRVIATDLSPDELPVSAGAADEDQLDVVAGAGDPVAGFPGGGSESVTADLEAGNYVLICNVPGHYVAGMSVGFEVTEP